MGAVGLTPGSLAAVLAVLAGCGGAAPSPPRADEDVARVDSVRDGDTILLTSGLRVRLVQIDAPELGIECHGDEAARTLRRLAPPGAPIRLERDPSLDDVDDHGRLLRYAFVVARHLNVELVEAGAAAPYFRRGHRGRYARELERAAHRARTARVGLWRACPATRLMPRRAVATGPAR